MTGSKPSREQSRSEKQAIKTTYATTREQQRKSGGDTASPLGEARVSRSGGRLQREIATKDELEQNFEIKGQKTRVHKGEEAHVPKKPDEANRPGEFRNPDESHAHRSKTEH